MKLKEIRESKGISQRQAALDLGFSPVVYGRYENGIRKPDPETLVRIANYFEVTVDAILGNSDMDTQKEPANDGRVDGNLAVMYDHLQQLSPAEQQRVLDFVEGILSTHEQ